MAEKNKNQITITLNSDHISYARSIADKLYEGNISMAFRKIVADHSTSFNEDVTD